MSPAVCNESNNPWRWCCTASNGEGRTCMRHKGHDGDHKNGPVEWAGVSS